MRGKSGNILTSKLRDYKTEKRRKEKVAYLMSLCEEASDTDQIGGKRGKGFFISGSAGHFVLKTENGDLLYYDHARSGRMEIRQLAQGENLRKGVVSGRFLANDNDEEFAELFEQANFKEYLDKASKKEYWI